MSHKVMLVTGATDGIGRQTALALARQGAFVWVHGRNAKKVQEVVDAVKREGGPGGDGLVADFASLASVRQMAEAVLKQAPRLEVLINNAGIFAQQRAVTGDGFESTFQVNHLAPFLLTNLLLPRLEQSAPARIVNVSSIAHNRGLIDFDDLQSERGFSGYGAYAMSKLCNVLFTRALARRLEGTGVTVNALHPGVINTKLLREGFGAVGHSVDEGARTSVHLAVSPEVEGVTGRYFADEREAQVAPQANDQQAQEELWAQSARLVGIGGAVGA